MDNQTKKPQLKKCELIDLYSFMGKKWTFAMLTNIGTNPITYNEMYSLSKHLINPTLLSNRLKDMIKFNLIKKENINCKTTYTITPEGRKLKEILHQIKLWSIENNYNLPDKCRYNAQNCECNLPQGCEICSCVCDEIFKVEHKTAI